MIPDPYTTSLAVAQFYRPPLVYKKPDHSALIKKIEKDRQRVTEPSKGRLLDMYA